MQTSINPDDSKKPLDELLQAADWPGPSPESLARLRRQFEELSSARVHKRKRRLAIAAVTVAAGLLIAVTAWGLRSSGGDKSPPNPTTNMAKDRLSPPATGNADTASAVARRPPPQDSNIEIVNLPSTQAEENTPISRPATPDEELMFRLLLIRRQSASFKPVDDKLLDEIIEQRISDLNSDLDQLAEPLLANRQLHERSLAERIRLFSGPRKIAAIELLGTVGTGNSTALLMNLSLNPEDHAAAVRALSRLAGPDTLARLAAEENDGQLQEEILAALLARGDSQAVGAYLDFVSPSGIGQRGLLALDRVSDPPVTMLFEYLRGPQVSRRMAAALALGRLDGPEISEKLFGMVRGNAGRQEAMVALLASSGNEASRYVNLARQDLNLAGIINGAQYQYHLLSMSQ